VRRSGVRLGFRECLFWLAIFGGDLGGGFWFGGCKEWRVMRWSVMISRVLSTYEEYGIETILSSFMGPKRNFLSFKSSHVQPAI
jgi:hypothetical protein